MPESPLPPTIVAIGARWRDDIRHHSEAVKQAYAPSLHAAPKHGIAVDRDIAYGPHPRQRLDVFVPSRTANSPPAPVIVFVHGGAFVRGERSLPSGVYDNVLYWFASQGWIGVNLEYRLAPATPYPGGAEDVALGIAWIGRHIAHRGGDPSRVVLFGHSAGGTHAASYVFDPHLGHAGRGVRALVLVSARLEADVLPENPNADGVRAYFGDDPALYAARSPMAHAACSTLPCLVVTAEFENPLLDVYGRTFAQRLAAARGGKPPYLAMPGHNHMSIVAHFNTAEDTLGRAIVAFCETVWR